MTLKVKATNVAAELEAAGFEKVGRQFDKYGKHWNVYKKDGRTFHFYSLPNADAEGNIEASFRDISEMRLYDSAPRRR